MKVLFFTVLLLLYVTASLQFKITSDERKLRCGPSEIRCTSRTTFTICNNVLDWILLQKIVMTCPSDHICVEGHTYPCVLHETSVSTTTVSGEPSTEPTTTEKLLTTNRPTTTEKIFTTNRPTTEPTTTEKIFTTNRPTTEPTTTEEIFTTNRPTTAPTTTEEIFTTNRPTTEPTTTEEILTTNRPTTKPTTTEEIFTTNRPTPAPTTTEEILTTDKSTTEEPHTTEGTTTKEPYIPHSAPSCKEDGNWLGPTCTSYYQCVYSSILWWGEWKAELKQCSTEHYFDAETLKCQKGTC